MRETRMTNTTKIRMPTMPHQQQSTLFEQPEKQFSESSSLDINHLDPLLESAMPLEGT